MGWAFNEKGAYPTGRGTPGRPGRPRQEMDDMSDEGKYDMLMRSMPHTYAQYVTRDNTTGVSEWTAAKHLAFISKKIALGIARGNARIIVNLPPGRGKSSLISKWLPLWYLEHRPKDRVMVCSYGAGLAEFWGRATRDEAETNKKIKLKLREDSKAVGQWMTREGGGMKCDGVGGSILGFRFSLGVIDDPIKDHQDANSPVVREALKNWFHYTFMTRMEPNASVVILMHRWHPKDLCGYLMEEHADTWEVIKLPELAEINDPLGRNIGEPLWPEKWTLESSIEARKSLAWPSMYQQNPQSELGDRVYDHFTQADNLDKDMHLRVDKETALGLALDFNISPGMHGLICQYDSREDMAIIDTELHGPSWRTEHLIKELIAWCVIRGHVVGKEGSFPWKVLDIYGDRSGRTRNTVTTDTDYKLIMKMLTAAKIPYRMKVPTANPPVNDRVLTVNEALKDGAGVVHLKVHPRCKRLLEDFNTQPRDELGQPDDSNKLLGHAGDAAGYFVYWARPAYHHEFKPQRVVGGA